MTRCCVVLLPGLLCDGAVWRDQREALAFADCTVPSYGGLSSITDMARFQMHAGSRHPGSITDSFFEPLSEAELAAWE